MKTFKASNCSHLIKNEALNKLKNAEIRLTF